MIKSSRSLLAAAVALAAQGAWSADTYLNVFLDKAPIEGVEVRLDGELIGSTDAVGRASSAIEEGHHKIELLRAGEIVSRFDYYTEANQDAEISVTFSDKASEPKVTVKKFATDDKSVVGFVGGIVRDANGKPVVDALIKDSESDVQTRTNQDGAFELALPRGTYNLNISHPDLSSASIDDVRVLAGLGVSSSITLYPKADGVDVAAPVIAGPIEEVMTLGTYKPLDSSSGIERFSTGVVDAMDVVQLERLGDSNVAIALTRLVGVTVNAGKYANIRGLDGRYISASLNGFLMPSTDPMRRDVQLDLFPSNILSGVEVQKNFSAGALGTTTGGELKIKTKGLPDERVGKVSVKLGGNSEVTGKDILSYKGSSSDAFTYDSGLRDMPSGFLEETNGASELFIGCDLDDCIDQFSAAVYAVQFQNEYDLKTTTGNPDVGMSVSFGDVLDSGVFGYYGAMNYNYETSARVDAELSDRSSAVGDYDRSEETYSIDGYLVLGSEFRAEDEILSRTMFIREGEKLARAESYIDKEGNSFDTGFLQWVERQFVSQQITGKHVFDFAADSHQFDWRIAYSNTQRHEPDRRAYYYLNGFLQLNGVERRWSDLDEDSVDFGFDYLAPVSLSEGVNTDITFGALLSDKSRTYELYRVGSRNGQNASQLDRRIENSPSDILSYQNYVDDVIRLNVLTAKTDSYDADEDIEAVYLNTNTEFGSEWTLEAGVRQEDFSQSIVYPNDDRSTPSKPLDSSELLPAAMLTFAPGDTWQFRFGGSQTVSYPGIIERSESRFYDPETDQLVVGNPNLVVSDIDNIDFRVEYYFSDEESVSLALFNKKISNPIERAVLDGSGSAAQGYTFRNNESATLNGVELDASANMFETTSWLGFVAGNITYISSEVELNSTSLRLEGENADGRELQGQSPWLANLQFGFDHFPWDQKFTLLVNYYDDRIYAVNRGSFVGPRYEIGRTMVNFNYEKQFGEAFKLKAKLGNLLDEPVEYSVDDEIVESYKEGIDYSLSASFEF